MPSYCRGGPPVVLRSDIADYSGVTNVMYKDDEILGTVQTTPFFDPSYDATVSRQTISHMH